MGIGLASVLVMRHTLILILLAFEFSCFGYSICDEVADKAKALPGIDKLYSDITSKCSAERLHLQSETDQLKSLDDKSLNKLEWIEVRDAIAIRKNQCVDQILLQRFSADSLGDMELTKTMRKSLENFEMKQIQQVHDMLVCTNTKLNKSYDLVGSELALDVRLKSRPGINANTLNSYVASSQKSLQRYAAVHRTQYQAAESVRDEDEPVTAVPQTDSND